MIYYWLLVAWMTLNLMDGCTVGASASMAQFLERPHEAAEQSWSYLLPTNFYSEINQQYYRRFRRRANLKKNFPMPYRWYPFEYARYI
ncbi:GL19101 [Drosophila persimilis]|uniref:GL19101 n=1 Tax=Drosophila persimilis TaxID=7234 RepID=B4G6T0_DROPE|nr:GL19101 [Drosophila persimilis]